MLPGESVKMPHRQARRYGVQQIVQFDVGYTIRPLHSGMLIRTQNHKLDLKIIYFNFFQTNITKATFRQFSLF